MSTLDINNITYVCDQAGRLVCVPYSISNLHTMATDLDLGVDSFCTNHYVIPQLQYDDIKPKCISVIPENIAEIIRSPEYAPIIISDAIPRQQPKPTNQVLPEHEELKYNGYTE